MIDCVSIARPHVFTGDLVREQHRLRHAECVVREGWRHVSVIDDGEYDDYDTRETEYFVSRHETGKVVGVIRSNPTTTPYMLQQRFRFLIDGSLPQDSHVFEASRLVVDRTSLPKGETRDIVVNELLVALMERGLQREISEYIGFMTPWIWGRTFIRIGWEPEWLGREQRLSEFDHPVRAGRLTVSRSIHEHLKRSTGLMGQTILNFG